MDRLEQSADVRLYIEMRSRLEVLEKTSPSRTGFAVPGPSRSFERELMSRERAAPGPSGTFGHERGHGQRDGPRESAAGSSSSRVGLSTGDRNQRDAEEYLAENGYVAVPLMSDQVERMLRPSNIVVDQVQRSFSIRSLDESSFTQRCMLPKSLAWPFMFETN